MSSSPVIAALIWDNRCTQHRVLADGSAPS
jgi:hypothetical protein